jgi:hypothetical protein
MRVKLFDHVTRVSVVTFSALGDIKIVAQNTDSLLYAIRAQVFIPESCSHRAKRDAGEPRLSIRPRHINS